MLYLFQLDLILFVDFIRFSTKTIMRPMERKTKSLRIEVSAFELDKNGIFPKQPQSSIEPFVAWMPNAIKNMKRREVRIIADSLINKPITRNMPKINSIQGNTNDVGKTKKSGSML